jgi:sporulation protein YlmC with PRC-barrel domain
VRGPRERSNILQSVDEGNPISYKLLQRGTAVQLSDGTRLGTVVEVLANDNEGIFDGIVVETANGRRFVDAPEVGRIAERLVTLTITPAEAAELPPPSPGAPEFKANPGAGRFSRLLGGGWRKR